MMTDPIRTRIAYLGAHGCVAPRAPIYQVFRLFNPMIDPGSERARFGYGNSVWWAAITGTPTRHTPVCACWTHRHSLDSSPRAAELKATVQIMTNISTKWTYRFVISPSMISLGGWATAVSECPKRWLCHLDSRVSVACPAPFTAVLDPKSWPASIQLMALGLGLGLGGSRIISLI